MPSARRTCAWSWATPSTCPPTSPSPRAPPPGSERRALDDEGEPFVLPIGEELDLHAFAPRDAVSVVEEYLRECRAQGVLVVRVVHGRGKGVQRAEVRRLLARLPGVASFDDAPPASGGWGATVVRLEPQLDS